MTGLVERILNAKADQARLAAELYEAEIELHDARGVPSRDLVERADALRVGLAAARTFADETVASAREEAWRIVRSLDPVYADAIVGSRLDPSIEPFVVIGAADRLRATR